MSGHVFHPGHDELHGITVVVETSGDETYVGRFDRQDEELAHLKDVGVHRTGDGGEDFPAFLTRTVKFGIKVEHRQLSLPTSQIKRIAKLSELTRS